MLSKWILLAVVGFVLLPNLNQHVQQHTVKLNFEQHLGWDQYIRLGTSPLVGILSAPLHSGITCCPFSLRQLVSVREVRDFRAKPKSRP